MDRVATSSYLLSLSLNQLNTVVYQIRGIHRIGSFYGAWSEVFSALGADSVNCALDQVWHFTCDLSNATKST
eukprot:2552533-Amphidinium_carterae.1